jgi:hypothetical protein
VGAQGVGDDQVVVVLAAAARGVYSGSADGSSGEGGGGVAGGDPSSSGSLAARATRAWRSGSGKVLPRRSARRRIPLAARELKQYFGGACGSKMANKVDPLASLGDSEVLAVQHSPRNAVPEFSQRREDDSEVSSLSAVEESSDVFHENPAWT